MQSVTVKARGAKVYLINNDLQAGLEMKTWEYADELAQAIRYFARGFGSGAKHQLNKSIAIRRENGIVVIESNDTIFLALPTAVALEISSAIIAKARIIESEVKAVDLAFDQALLLRSGRLPNIGLTNDVRIQQEAAREAWLNPILRKALPFGIAAQTQVGTPEVHRDR